MRWTWKTRHTDESGLALLEVLAGLVIATAVVSAANMLLSGTLGLYLSRGTDAKRLVDTSTIYWTLQEIAQNSSGIGTETLTTNNSGQFVPDTTNGPVSVLAVWVSNLHGILPADSAAYHAAAGGDFIAIGLVPENGILTLAVFPGGDSYDPTANPPVYPPSEDVYPLFTGGTDFSGTTFSVKAPIDGLKRSTVFEVNLVRQAVQPGTYSGTLSKRSTVGTQVFDFMIGTVDY